MQQVQPITVIDLFPQERERLLELFVGLTAEDWEKPTICPGWSVKDIGLHLLSDDLGYLARGRDHFSDPFFRNKDMQSWASLVQNINETNNLWVTAARRLSPALLIDLLTLTGKQFHDYLCTLDPMAINGVVSWAGPEHAPAWLDIAREYTERWVHQQHMRDAVDRPGLKERHFFHPVIDAFVWALPHTYRAVSVATRTVLKFVVTGEAGGTWYLLGEASGGWSLWQEVPFPLTAVVTMDQETCWRLFTRGMTGDQARARTTIEGDPTLTEQIFGTVSILA